MKWEINGRKLARPDLIIRRLAIYPFYFLAKCALFLTVFIGWGKHEALRHWEI